MRLETFLQSSRIDWHRASPDQIYVNCVFCNETRYRLGVNLAKRDFHCFNCNAHGSIFSLLRKWNANNVVITGTSREERNVLIDLPEDFGLLADIEPDDWGMGQLVKYCYTRGITSDIMRAYHIGGCLEGTYRYRVIFPIFTGVTLHTFIGRGIFKEQEPKYRNAKGGVRALWGIQDKRKKYAVVTEGVIKALAMLPVVGAWADSLAALGNTFSEFQRQQIRDAGYTDVLLIPDPGAPGITGSISIAEGLREDGVRVFLPKVLPAAQADEVDETERARWVESAEPYSSGMRLRLLWEVGKC